MMTSGTQARIKIKTVQFGDWADCGPIVEVRCEETGEPYTRRPDPNLVVIAETPRGEVFVLQADLGLPDDPVALRRTEALVAKIKAKGSIDPGRWDFWRVVYGSDAYCDEEAFIVEREKTDALIFEAFGR